MIEEEHWQKLLESRGRISSGRTPWRRCLNHHPLLNLPRNLWLLLEECQRTVPSQDDPLMRMRRPIPPVSANQQRRLPFRPCHPPPHLRRRPTWNNPALPTWWPETTRCPARMPPCPPRTQDCMSMLTTCIDRTRKRLVKLRLEISPCGPGKSRLTFHLSPNRITLSPSPRRFVQRRMARAADRRPSEEAVNGSLNRPWNLSRAENHPTLH
jgi:hypothetical protein